MIHSPFSTPSAATCCACTSTSTLAGRSALLNYTTHGEDDDAFSAVSQQPALDQQVVIDILERIDEAKDKDELAAIWKAAVGVLRAASDTTGYERVKAAAAERGKALEGTEK